MVNKADRKEITIDNYIEIERNIAHKYKMGESVFRTEKEHVMVQK